MGVNINTELQTIRQGRYGNDIRIAIHDALEKIADQEIEPTPGGVNTVVRPFTNPSSIPGVAPVKSLINMIGYSAIIIAASVEEE